MKSLSYFSVILALSAFFLIASSQQSQAQLAGIWTCVQNQNNANSDQDFAYLEVVEHSFLSFKVVHFYYAEVCYDKHAGKYIITRTIIGAAHKKGNRYSLMNGKSEAMVITQDSSGQFNWQTVGGPTGGYLRKGKLDTSKIPNC